METRQGYSIKTPQKVTIRQDQEQKIDNNDQDAWTT